MCCTDTRYREPSDLVHRTKVMEDRDETFTIQIKQGHVELHGEQAFLRRAKDLGDLISRFSSHVADVNLTFTRHDQPACQLGYFHKERMIELAGLGDCESILSSDPGAVTDEMEETLDHPNSSSRATGRYPTGRTGVPLRLHFEWQRRRRWWTRRQGATRRTSSSLTPQRTLRTSRDLVLISTMCVPSSPRSLRTY